MQQTMPSGPALSSVDFFKAKLQFEIGPVELKRLLEEKNSLIVLDTRDKDSFVKEHIPGAVNIPQAEIARRLAELPRDKTVVAYCWSITCHLATKAALELAHRGYKIQELAGGIRSWKETGLPVEGERSVPGRA